MLKTIRFRLKAQVSVIYHPLSEDETNKIVQITNKKLGVKNGKLSKKALEQLIQIGFVLDQYKMGVSFLVESNQNYNNLNDSLGIGRLYVRKDKEVKRLKSFAYSLNTILLSLLYFRPIISEISPEFKDFSFVFMKEVLDEVMQEQLEKLR